MTREEAKEVFLNRGYIEVDGGTICDMNKWRESCRVISEWLKQKPCSDAVSRKEVKEVLYKPRKAILTFEDFEKELDSLPPATPTADVVEYSKLYGLAEEIRCVMCTNAMKGDSGCDGGCQVDEDTYKRVIDTIENHIGK